MKAGKETDYSIIDIGAVVNLLDTPRQELRFGGFALSTWFQFKGFTRDQLDRFKAEIEKEGGRIYFANKGDYISSFVDIEDALEDYYESVDMGITDVEIHVIVEVAGKYLTGNALANNAELLSLIGACETNLQLPEQCEGYTEIQGVDKDGNTVFFNICFGAALVLAKKGVPFGFNCDGNGGWVIFSQQN